ncbi:MAG TPA: CoA transferase, partial [Pseudonocardiaceae bacterium]|nr:CoA transferase [Pseudonocardiaceae bacterium]
AQHATIAPYGPFTTADHDTVLLAIQNEREWHTFCQVVLDQPTIAGDHRFATNSARVEHRDELNAVIAARFATLDTGTVVTLLDKANVANARLNSVAQFLDHPALAGRDRWRTVGTPGGDIQALLPPATLSDIDPAMNPVPALGEHTDAILRGLGHTDTDIAALRAARVI